MPIGSPTMSQADIERERRLHSLPLAILEKAHGAERAAARYARVREQRERADAQMPDFVAPTALQKVGHYLRLAIYPANALAEMTAGAATASYLARTLLGVSDRHVWLAPFAFALIVLALEMFVAHARESGRGVFGAAPLGWTLFAVVLVVMLVGLQATSQLTGAMQPLNSGAPVRTLSQLGWVDWARIGFACLLLGSLHVAVLFGGASSENSLAYALARPNRRLAVFLEQRHARVEEERMTQLGKLATAYHAHRTLHEARGFSPGEPPAYDATTLARLNMLATRRPDRPGADADTRSSAAGQGPAPVAGRVDAEQPGGVTAEVPSTSEQADQASHGSEAENAYLRAVLDARVRNDDGEVRARTR